MNRQHAISFLNRTLFALLLPALFFTKSALTSPPPRCTTAPCGIVGWWPGDSNANDISSNNNNGDFTGGSYVPGEVSDAFSFDGTGTTLVSVPQSSTLEPSKVTVDAWVQANGSPGQFKYLVAKGGGGCANPASYALYTGSSGGLFFYVSDGTTVYLSPDAGTGIWDNNWHFVAGTYDGSSVKLYVDGTLVGSNPVSVAIAYGLLDNTLSIGTYPSCGDNLSFNGNIDETEVFSRALRQGEIWRIFNAGSAGKCKN